ncbi:MULTISPECIES: porin [unclassified Psychrobacter]|uniref:porin n=1 Tax=unclassified Psychrobacter TaxID=196806 RepID=UPI000C326A94|nr:MULTISPECIES: porin [unclassified Psychrobacter]MBA6244358.1 porin [Psychrobacter sp. Urea-trap-18]MBA6287142.1 porin [Psychrobacter sp. Urea-trap-16]MBA6319385.1 porin [Psychrobacter sp. Urea-trap-20]MBA6335439.1 porin [Psychrobacter sp. Urea-trap-19]PKG59484.1 porin [Psychrobacter sp. Choline-3u-12]
MKKLLLATAVAALSVSAAHAAPTVYGKAFLTLDYVSTDYDAANKTDEDTFKLNSNASRIGFKGDDDLTDTTKLIYQLEYQINPDDDSQQFKSRNTYVGLAHNTLGTVLAGRHDTPLKLAQNKVDVFNDTLFDIKNAGVSGENRANNTLAYQSPVIVGMPVSFMAATALSETDADGNILVSAASGTKPAVYRDRKVKDNGYSALLAYDKNGVYLAGAYDKDMGANNVNTGVIDNTWRLVAGLDMGKMNMVSGLTLGALYQQSQYYDNYSIVNNNRVNKASEDEKSWLISGKYKVGATPWAVKAQYVNTTDEKGVKDADVNEIAVGGEYAFNKATTGHIYAGQISRDNNKDDLIVGTGIEYKF